MTIATAIKNQGMMIAINTNDPTMFAKVIKNIRIESAMVLSIVSMSLANLFMIRPRGVVSKKLIGACMVELIARRCRDLEAKFVRKPMAAPDVKNVMVKETPRAA